MKTDNKNILVIENQMAEFKLIVSFLNNYNVYPKVDCFQNFLNIVHVAINKQYNNEYRKKALNHISDITGDGNPFNNGKPVDLILMDHILGGAHFCHTGIDLANYINRNRKDNPIPVVFLSRTPQDGKEKLEGNYSGNDLFDLLCSSNRMGYENGYKKIYANSCDWVHKGYFGDECLDEKYFNAYVIKAINNIMPLSDKESLMKKIEIIINQDYYVHKDIKDMLISINERICEGEKYTEEFKAAIMNYKKNDMTPELTEIIKNKCYE